MIEQDPVPGRSDKLREAIARKGLPGSISKAVNVQYAREIGSDLGGSYGIERFGVGSLLSTDTALGLLANIGKPIVEAPMQLARGAQWIADQGKPQGLRSEDVIGAIPTDLRDALPTDLGLKLESRLAQAGALRTPSEIVGEILPMTTGTGLVGKAATLPGQMIREVAAPVTKLGEYLISKSPKLQKWSMLAKHLPPLLGTSSGFALHGFVAQEGDAAQRAAAAAHNMVAGAGIHMLGSLANAAEQAILSKLVPARDKKLLFRAIDEIKKGNAGPSAELLRSASRMDMGINALVQASGAAIEATGFAGLDPQFWTDVVAGVGGDKEAMGRALETWSGSLAAMLLVRTGRPDAVRTFRRERPDLNDFQTRLNAAEVRDLVPVPKRPQEPGGMPEGPKPPMLPNAPQGEGQKLLTGPREEGQKLLTGPQQSSGPPLLPAPKDPLLLKNPPGMADGPREAAVSAAYRLPALQKASKPLFDSGWDLQPDIEISDTGRNTITMEFAGAGKLRMWENETQAGPAVEAFGLEVPPDVFKIVRGDVEVPEGTENIRMVGAVAEEFVNDLAIVSMLRRIRGEILFGSQGEAWAGGPWKGDGVWHTIGLDGQHYYKAPLGEWQKAEGAPVMPVENGAASNPQIARWIQLAQDLRMNAAPTPGIDVLEASIMLALRGDLQASRSTQELLKLFTEEWMPGSGMMNADLIAPALRSDNIDSIGMTIGQVAAGHLTAELAAAKLAQLLTGPQKLLPYQEPGQEAAPQQAAEAAPAPAPAAQPTAPTAEAAPAAPKAATKKPEEIAGARDWSRAPRDARRLAAKQYLEARPDATVAELRDTFFIPRETARDLRKRRNEAGSVAGELLSVPMRGGLAAAEVALKFGRALIKSTSREIARLGRAPGEKMSQRLRASMSFGDAVRGAAMTRWKPGAKAAHKLGEEWMGQLEQVKAADGSTYDTWRWIKLAEGRIEPKKGHEAVFAKSAREAGLTLQWTHAGIGGWYMGTDQKWHRSEKMGRFVVPRKYSRDEEKGYRKLLDNPTDRAEWFDMLARKNAIPGLTGEKLLQEYLNSRGDKKVETMEHIAAFEQQRALDHVPAVWTANSGKTYEILEKDPRAAMHDIIVQQSGRIGVEKYFGQNLPDELRRKENIALEGPDKAIKQFRMEMEQLDMPSEERDLAHTLAKNMLERLQGREPEPAGAIVRKLQDIVTLRRAFMSWTQGVYDIFAIGSEPVAYTGLWTQAKTLWSLLKDRGLGEAIRDAEQFGSVLHELGNLDLGWASTPMQKLAQYMSKPSNWLEAVKAAIFDRNAKLWLETIGNGKPRKDDYEILTDYLHFTPEQAESVINRTATPDLLGQVRREMVKALTNRKPIADRSELASNPTFKGLVDFVGWSTARAERIIDDIAAIGKSLHSRNAKTGQIVRRMRRLMMRATGISFAGSGSLLLGYLLLGLIRLDPQEGWQAFVRDVVNYPGKTLGKAIAGQVVAGPLGQTATAVVAGEEEIEEVAARYIAPFGMLLGAYKALARGGNPYAAMARTGESLGMLPKEVREMVTAANAYYTGSKEFENVSRAVNRFRILEGIKPIFGPKDKPEEFYAAMRDIGKLLQSDKIPDNFADLAQKQIETALGLQPGESVTGKLRSMAWLTNLSDEQEDRLITYLGPEMYRTVIAHDDALYSLAGDIDNRTGTYPTEWHKDLAYAARRAESGATRVWGQLVERAVRDNSMALVNKVAPPINIDELASVMADHPQTIHGDDSLFSDTQALLLLNHTSQPELARAIRSNLKTRITMAKAAFERSKIRETVIERLRDAKLSEEPK